MSRNPSSLKLSGPDRGLEAPSDSHALSGCPEMSANVRDSEISGFSIRQITIWGVEHHAK